MEQIQYQELSISKINRTQNHSQFLDKKKGRFQENENCNNKNNSYLTLLIAKAWIHRDL